LIFLPWENPVGLLAVCQMTASHGIVLGGVAEPFRSAWFRASER
jgi:hypothetical protein